MQYTCTHTKQATYSKMFKIHCTCTHVYVQMGKCLLITPLCTQLYTCTVVQ